MAPNTTVTPLLCPHVPLSVYPWSALEPPPPPHCPELAFNASVYYLIISAHVSIYWLMGLLSWRVIKLFTRHNTVYFWSIQWTACSIAGVNIAEDVHLFGPNNDPAIKLAYKILMTIFITGAIPGFALVLWSRLHLVTSNKLLLRCLLALIIVIGSTTSIVKVVGFWRSTTTLGYRLSRAGMYLTIVMNSVEILIMVVYIVAFWRFSQPLPLKDPATAKVLRLLSAAICYVFIFASSCVTTQLVNMFHAHAIVSLGFAFKLWIEFWILLQVIELSGKARRAAESLPSPFSVTEDRFDTEKGWSSSPSTSTT